MPSEAQTRFPTTIWAQCRNEQPFPVVIQIIKPANSIYDIPCISCPHCSRLYLLGKKGEWVSDRPLKFLSFPNEVEEVRKTAIG